MRKALIVLIALTLIGTASVSAAPSAKELADKNAGELFATAMTKLGLRKALRASAMLLACGDTAHDAALTDVVRKIESKTLRIAALTPIPAASFSEVSALALQKLHGLEAGYSLGYSERVLAEVNTDALKRANCTIAVSMAKEAIAEAAAL